MLVALDFDPPDELWANAENDLHEFMLIMKRYNQREGDMAAVYLALHRRENFPHMCVNNVPVLWTNLHGVLEAFRRRNWPIGENRWELTGPFWE